MAEERVEADGEERSLRFTRSSTVLNSLLRIYGKGKVPPMLVLHIVGADHR